MDAGGVSLAPAAEELKFESNISINEIDDSTKDDIPGSESLEGLGEAQDLEPTLSALAQFQD